MAIVLSGTTGIDMGNTPVSNASQVEVQNNQVTPFSGFKNYIINGNFDVWQYATSQTTSGYGSADRWLNIHSVSSKTVTKQFSEVLASNVMRTVVTSVAGANSYVRSIQRIEDITKYAGKTITLSFDGQVDTNKNIAVSFSSIYGTGGTPTTQEDYGLTLVPLITSFRRKSITVTIPSLVGKTFGTDGIHTSFLQVQFWFDAGSNTLASSLGQQSGTFDIAEVQIEEGSVATPFEQRPYGLELSLCQRYYEYDTSCAIKCEQLCDNRGATQLEGMINFNVQKRVSPSMSNISFNSGTYGAITRINQNGVIVQSTGSSTAIAVYVNSYSASAEI